MKNLKSTIAAILSLSALAFILYKSIAVFLGITLFEDYVYWTGIMTIVWFLIAPLWLWKK